MIPLHVRPARAEDVPAILPMVRAIWALHEEWDLERFGVLPDVVERYARWLPERANDPRSVLLIAEDLETAQASGFLVGTVESSIPVYRVREFGFIHDVWVQPASRGRGVGAMLIDQAASRFRAIGVSQVRLETARANEGARKLFESRGFRISAVEMMRTL